MGSNANILVAARLDGDTINAATGSASAYTPSGGFNYATGKRRTGVHFDLTGTTDGDEVLYPLTTFDLADHACVLMHCVVTPKIDLIDTNSTQYYFMQLGDGYDNQKLYLLHSDTYDGLELVGRESVLTRLTFPDLDMLTDESYSLAILIKNDTTNGDLMMSFWLNGRMIRAIELPTTSFTTDIDQLYIGNAFSSHARPAKSVIEDVLLAVSDDPNAYDADTIWKLHDQGLDLACVDDPTIYENQKTVVGYVKEATGTGVVPRWVEPDGLTVWGYKVSDRDQLMKSTDQGENWSLAHDFNNGLPIRGITGTPEDELYVIYGGSIQRSASRTSLSFSQDQALTSSDHYVTQWALWYDPATGLLWAGEYEQQPAAADCKLYSKTAGEAGGWTEKRELAEHIHTFGVLRDGTVVLTGGDTTNTTEQSVDVGDNWTTVITGDAGTGAPATEEQTQAQLIELANGIVVQGSDKTTSRALAQIWERGSSGHTYDKVNALISRIGPVSGDLNANVFAMHQASNGTVWFHLHAESQVDRHSSIWLMHPDSRAPLMAEDLGAVTWADANGYVETADYIMHDVYRWRKTARVDLGLPSGFTNDRGRLDGEIGRPLRGRL